MNINTLSTPQGPIEFATIGSGHPIIVLHGSPGGWEQMAAEFSFLTEHGFQLIAPNRPGYAGTPLSSGETVDQQATLFASLMQELGHSRYAIAAWSGGGPAAIQLAALNPEAVSRLYLQACITKKQLYSEKEQKMTEPLFNPQVAMATKLLAKWRPKFLLKSMIQQEYDCTKKQAKQRLKKLIKDRSLLDYSKKIISSMIPPDQRETGFRHDNTQFEQIQHLSFDEIIAPTLILQGKLDQLVRADHAELAHQRIANSQLLLLDGVTHMPRLSEHYKQVQQRILKFFIESLKE
mgnify:CR=1 FL=1